MKMNSRADALSEEVAATLERAKRLRSDAWQARMSASDTREAAKALHQRVTSARKKAQSRKKK